MTILAIAAGGAVGALLRYGLTSFINRFTDTLLPWGTITVNLFGSFVIGGVAALFDRMTVNATFRAFLLVGLIGSFTTFSTYMMESFRMLSEGRTGPALANLLVSTCLGLICVFLGFISVRGILAAAV